MPRPELSFQKVCIGTVQNSRRPKGSPERFLTLEPLRGLPPSRSTRGVLRRDYPPLGLIVRQFIRSAFGVWRSRFVLVLVLESGRAECRSDCGCNWDSAKYSDTPSLPCPALSRTRTIRSPTAETIRHSTKSETLPGLLVRNLLGLLPVLRRRTENRKYEFSYRIFYQVYQITSCLLSIGYETQK